MLSFWGAQIRISGLTDEKLKKIAQSILDDGFTLSYAARILTVLNATLRHAKIAHEIIYTESKMSEKWKLTSTAPRRTFAPTDPDKASRR